MVYDEDKFEKDSIYRLYVLICSYLTGKINRLEFENIFNSYMPEHELFHEAIYKKSGMKIFKIKCSWFKGEVVNFDIITMQDKAILFQDFIQEYLQNEEVLSEQLKLIGG